MVPPPGCSAKPAMPGSVSRSAAASTSIREDAPAGHARRILLGRRGVDGVLDRSEGRLAVVFMTQVIGSDARLTLRRDLRTLVYSALTRSHV